MKTRSNADSCELQYVVPPSKRPACVVFSQGIPADWAARISGYLHPILWYDDAIGESVLSSLAALAPRSTRLVVESVRPEKSLDFARRLWAAMADHSCDLAIAVGGGTLCDVVGWAATEFRRGIDHVFIPTTLLAMIDASIGGKNGIDAFGAKNIIGAINPAAQTLVSASFLTTLPLPESRAAMAEAVKIAMLYDIELLEEILVAARLLSRGEPPGIALVTRIATIKAGIVEREKGEREGLLYGHNIGHALETILHPTLKHGEAVSIGLTIEGALAVADGVLHEDAWRSQQRALARLGLPSAIPADVSISTLVDTMEHYRLYRGSEFLFVTPNTRDGGGASNRQPYLRVPRARIKDDLTAAAGWAAENGEPAG